MAATHSTSARPGSWRLRIVIGAIVTAIVGSAMAGWLIARTSSPPSGPVILISVDSLRADRLGAYGYRAARTPHIDALAADGILFERAYSHAPLTVPAHTAILSGRLPFETGIREDEGAVLPPKTPMLPALLRKRGFKTAGIVSSGLLGRQTGLAPFFHFYDDDMPGRAPGTPAAAVHRDAAATVEVAKHWVDQQNYRFFLFLHLDEPRAPYAPQAGFATGDPYDGEVAQADAAIGRFVSFLKERDLYDRAIIVLVSDHGEALGEHGEQGHGLFLYDSTLRVPLIVKMPKGEGAGRRRTELVQQIDVLPTVLDLMGAPRPSSLRGRSLSRLLDSDDATLPASTVYSESLVAQRRFGWSPLFSVTDGRYRYIRAPRPELYDIVQDRAERENVAAGSPAPVAELGGSLDRYLAAIPASPALPLGDDLRNALGLAPVVPVTEAPGSQAEAPASHPRAESGPSVPATASAARPGDHRPAPADPKDRLALIDRLRTAEEARADGRPLDALVIYREALREDPEMPAVWRTLGSLLLTIGQPGVALDSLARAVELNPTDLEAVNGAALSLVRLGRFDEAARVAAEAARLDPVTGNELLARVELERKDYAAAQRAAAAAGQADSGSPFVAFVRGVELFDGGKFADAVVPLDEAVRLAAARPIRTPDVSFYSGDALAKAGKAREAEAQLREELKWFPENVRARESLLSLYQDAGRATEIAALIAGLVQALPTPEGYAAAWRLSLAAGDKAGAAAFRARGRRLFGDSALRAAEAGTRQ